MLQLCVQNSPQEARNMLLQNPQLAYALLQAQVVMRIVDPEIALVRPVLSTTSVSVRVCVRAALRLEGLLKPQSPHDTAWHAQSVT